MKKISTAVAVSLALICSMPLVAQETSVGGGNVQSVIAGDLNLYNFILEVKEKVGTEDLTVERGKSFIVQDVRVFKLYDEYIENGYPVFLAINETNKATLRIIKKAKEAEENSVKQEAEAKAIK